MMVNTDLTQIVYSKDLTLDMQCITNVYIQVHMVVLDITSLFHHYYRLMHQALPTIESGFTQSQKSKSTLMTQP